LAQLPLPLSLSRLVSATATATTAADACMSHGPLLTAFAEFVSYFFRLLYLVHMAGGTFAVGAVATTANADSENSSKGAKKGGEGEKKYSLQSI